MGKRFHHLLINIGIFLVLCFSQFLPVKAQEEFSISLLDISVTPIPNQVSSQVDIYLSILDGNNTPIKNISIENFNLEEDSQPVSLQNVQTASLIPTGITLLVDTSGSMQGEYINRARAAAGDFLSRLNPSDKAALISFSDKIKTISNFTSDLELIRGLVNQLDSVPLGGTCLYDAIQTALKLSGTISGGVRAIVLLTDGKDQVYGGDACSQLSFQEVMDLSSKKETRIPLYILGLGKEIDKYSLQQLASAFGGGFFFVVDTSQLDFQFSRVYEQIKSQYRLRFISNAVTGKHKLNIDTTIAGKKHQVEDQFDIPKYPPVLKFISPLEGQKVNDIIKIDVDIVGNRDLIKKIRYEKDGIPINGAPDKPQSFDLNISASAPVGIKIGAVALDENNMEISRAEVHIGYQPVEKIIPTISDPSGGNSPIKNNLIFYIAGGVIFLLLITGSIFLYISQQKRSLPRLYVINATDPATIGQTYIIRATNSKRSVSIGRSLQNDLPFPMEETVSRHHAEITRTGKTWQISEVRTQTIQGVKPPTNGTFVNEKQIPYGYVFLKQNDTIRLGDTLFLQFVIGDQPPTIRTHSAGTESPTIAIHPRNR